MGSLTEPSRAFKPFFFPWAYDYWLKHEKMHWLADEVPMGDDVQQWGSMEPRLKSLAIAIMRMFVQADIDVHACYHKIFMATFKPTEVSMMLSSFSNRETVHIQAYSHLIDTLGLPEEEYGAFLEYEEMKAKHDFMQSFDPKNPHDVALSLAGVSAFGEGLQLFASFAVLLNFPRQNLLKGMGQMIAWSVRDESMHCEGIMRLFHAYLAEQSIDRTRLDEDITAMCKNVVETEDKFIDLAFVEGDVPGLTAAGLKNYVRYMADYRLRQLGVAAIYGIDRNPEPWVDSAAVAVEHVNFFEQQATEYSKAATKGEWSDAF